MTIEKIQIVKNACHERFYDLSQKLQKRYNRFFFNFISNALLNSFSKLRFTYYGGEQICFPHFGIPPIKEKLNSLSELLKIQSGLNVSCSVGHIECLWGKLKHRFVIDIFLTKTRRIYYEKGNHF